MTEGEAAGGTSANTASVSPVADQAILVHVTGNRSDSVNVGEPTLSGCGITWESIGFVAVDTAGAGRMSSALFFGVNASPSSGAITITPPSETWGQFGWQVDTFPGAGSYLQPQTSPGGTATTRTLTMASFAAGSGVACYGAAASDAGTFTFDSTPTYTNTDEYLNTGFVHMGFEFYDGEDLSVVMTYSLSVAFSTHAVELTAGEEPPPPTPVVQVLQTPLRW